MTPLLLTKLLPPRLSHITIVRQRLLDQLSNGARGKLNLIHAPAGYGKTTLAAAWIAAQRQQVAEYATAWLTLEAYDNDPTRFLNYFIGAWQQIDPEIGVSLAEALQAGQQSIESYGLLNQLINELAHRPTPLALVLDDWHTIENETVQSLVQYWIEHVPAHIHTLITSRELPQMPLARWRVHGQLTVIDAPALQFSVAEVGRFLREGMKLDLTDADIARLTSQTEGWIGALQLMALSLQGGADIEVQLAQLPGNERYLVDYLTNEVLSRQSAELRQFLMDTSILDRFNSALCDAVSEGNNGRLMLSDIEQRNLFLIPLEASGGWYRYHPLLSGALRQQLAGEQPATYRALNGRASDWLRHHNYFEEAIEHGLEAQRYHDVAQHLSERAYDYLWGNGRAVSLFGWCKRLPEDVLMEHPKIMLAYGWAILSVKGFDETASYLRRIRPLLGEHLDSAETSSELAVLEAEADLYLGNDIDGVITKLAAVDFNSLHNRHLRGLVYQVQGYAQRLNGDAKAAIGSLQLSRQLLSQRSSLAWWVFASGDLAEARMIQGDLNAAEIVYREIIASLPPEQYLANPILDIAFIGYSALQLKRNRLNDALDHIQRSLAISRTAHRNRNVTRAGLEMLARIRQAQGGWEDTLELLSQIEAIVRQQPYPRIHFHIATLGARLHSLQNDHDTVTVWAASFDHERPPFVPHLQYHTSQLVYAGWLLYRDPAAALDFLTVCQAQADAEGWRENQLVGAVLQASASQRLGRTPAALDHLREAIRLARPGGYLRVFVEQAVDIAPLLRELVREGDTDPFLGAIQAAFLPAGVTIQPLIDPLTQREVEILQLIGAGLSNPEIAQRLIIATGTVARHSNNIYGKLGRTQPHRSHPARSSFRPHLNKIPTNTQPNKRLNKRLFILTVPEQT